jgi:hypothetical protein
MHEALSRQLTPSQRKAVFHTEGPLLVLAGPGSGKTRVITYRIAALIESGVRPYNICAITFTNKAAEEMRQRAVALGASAGAHISTYHSTYHSLCVRILRQYSEQAGIERNFTIYDEADQTRCIKETIKECRFDTTNFPPGRMLAAISTLKNKLVDAESFRTEADDFFTRTLAEVYLAFFDSATASTSTICCSRPPSCSAIVPMSVHNLETASDSCSLTSIRTPTTPSTGSPGRLSRSTVTFAPRAIRTSPSTVGEGPTFATSWPLKRIGPRRPSSN